jgi:ethanolamine ammonia-lyase small subunit
MSEILPGTDAPDPWRELRRYTPARVALGRAGDALPVSRLLEFQAAHARARDAVHLEVDVDAIEEALADLWTTRVHSSAAERTQYLQRPDLGRRLDPPCAAVLEDLGSDVVFVVGDGLSAAAVHDHAVPMLRAILARLTDWDVAPVVLATQARVALGDEIGALLGARMAVMLIGERPGLSAANSLGIYLTYEPRVGRRDSERNCVSNVHPPDGLGYGAAANKLVHLMTEAKRLGLTGISLKDDLPRIGSS